MGRLMVDELKRYLAGQPLKWQITMEMAKNAAVTAQGDSPLIKTQNFSFMSIAL
ncbi:MAG: hypothetical protein WCI51_10030 [Lentisphaerota bacterium]